MAVDEYMLVSMEEREVPGMRGPRGRPEAEPRDEEDMLRGPVMAGRCVEGEGPEMGPMEPDDRLEALRPSPLKKEDLGLIALGGLKLELSGGRELFGRLRTPGKGTGGLAMSRGLKVPLRISRAL